jgi:hypothetical protein
MPGLTLDDLPEHVKRPCGGQGASPASELGGADLGGLGDAVGGALARLRRSMEMNRRCGLSWGGRRSCPAP